MNLIVKCNRFVLTPLADIFHSMSTTNKPKKYAYCVDKLKWQA